ncbi:type II toxin-antitoxin system RelE/ParE family toxin [Saccharopolyspora sp. 6M]|uniref:type II toxin-antitoxin system RelE/ParE family toxin n=1 Tax=Saccharopolyspora sp. 6M TaxID=2877237 RepID=UPI001CD65FC4|nr:type II toxin-antitoxin system RelE/ParE family toxin [Saccharopolyspora sp. 6M]MCA1229487.1 type II toxin-antitoxin system RelE/ParE family toxin [Saccharopolyspora sp. 6M]
MRDALKSRAFECTPRELAVVHAVEHINDLRIPPGNRLEQLSIRVKQQWRICFTWHGGDVHDVEIVDYH